MGERCRLLLQPNRRRQSPGDALAVRALLANSLRLLMMRSKISLIMSIFGQDFYQTYARTRVERGFFSCFFLPQTQENKQKVPRNGTFSFARESQVARNSG